MIIPLRGYSHKQLKLDSLIERLCPGGQFWSLRSSGKSGPGYTWRQTSLQACRWGIAGYFSRRKMTTVRHRKVVSGNIYPVHHRHASGCSNGDLRKIYFTTSPMYKSVFISRGIPWYEKPFTWVDTTVMKSPSYTTLNRSYRRLVRYEKCQAREKAANFKTEMSTLFSSSSLPPKGRTAFIVSETSG